MVCLSNLYIITNFPIICCCFLFNTEFIEQSQYVCLLWNVCLAWNYPRVWRKQFIFPKEISVQSVMYPKHPYAQLLSELVLVSQIKYMEEIILKHFSKYSSFHTLPSRLSLRLAHNYKYYITHLVFWLSGEKNTKFSKTMK